MASAPRIIQEYRAPPTGLSGSLEKGFPLSSLCSFRSPRSAGNFEDIEPKFHFSPAQGRPAIPGFTSHGLTCRILF
jgi:hypothetical protein